MTQGQRRLLDIVFVVFVAVTLVPPWMERDEDRRHYQHRGFDVMWRSGYSSSIELNYRMLAYEWACLFVGASILYRRLS